MHTVTSPGLTPFALATAPMLYETGAEMSTRPAAAGPVTYALTDAHARQPDVNSPADNYGPESDAREAARHRGKPDGPRQPSPGSGRHRSDYGWYCRNLHRPSPATLIMYAP